MALPTGPIPRVAFDEIIEEPWGDSVGQSINNLYEAFTWATWNPAGGTEHLAETGGVMGTWFTLGGPAPIEFQVPDWALQAYVVYSLSGVQYLPTSAGRTSYLLQAQFGTLNGRQVRYSGQGGWFGMTWADQFTDIEAITSGDRLIRIRAQRVEGTGTERWRFFDQSDIAVSITYHGAIDFYPGL